MSMSMPLHPVISPQICRSKDICYILLLKQFRNERLLADPNRLRQISERIPAGRWGTPEDFAGPIVFLASAASQYVNGEILLVDGVRNYPPLRSIVHQLIILLHFFHDAPYSQYGSNMHISGCINAYMHT